MNSNQERMFRGMLILLGVLAAFIIAEGTLRFLHLGYNNSPLEFDPVLHHRHPKNYKFLSYVPSDSYGGHVVKYDSEGVVVGSASKSDRVEGHTPFRIALMGDSFVEAGQVPYEKSFAGLLNQAVGDAKAVRNYRVTSYSPILYLLQWHHSVKNFRPTHVFVMLFSGDINEDSNYSAGAVFVGEDPVAVPGPTGDLWKKISRKSYLIRFFVMNYRRVKWLITHWKGENHVRGKDYVEESPEINGSLSERYLLKLNEEVSKAGTKFILMAVPSQYLINYQEIKEGFISFPEKVKQWALLHSIRYCDLTPAFVRASKDEKLFIKNDIHFTKKGHQLVFEVIYHEYPEIFNRRST